MKPKLLTFFVFCELFCYLSLCLLNLCFGVYHFHIHNLSTFPPTSLQLEDVSDAGINWRYEITSTKYISFFMVVQHRIRLVSSYDEAIKSGCDS